MTPQEEETIEFIQTVFGDLWPVIYHHTSYEQCRAILADAMKLKRACRKPPRLEPPPINRLQWN